MQEIKDEQVRQAEIQQCGSQSYQLVDDNEKSDKRLVRMRFVGITFDPDSYSYGESQLNDALDHGYKMIRDYPTGAGVVIALGLYKNGAV